MLKCDRPILLDTVAANSEPKNIKGAAQCSL